MQDPIQTFEPFNLGLSNAFLISVLVVALSALFIFFNSRRKVAYYEKKMKQLFSMLAFFALLIAASTAFFSWWNSQKIKTVKIYKDRIEIPTGEVRLKNIHSAYIYLNEQKGPFSGSLTSDTTKLLIIEEVNGMRHVLSEENYEIKGMLTAITSEAGK